MAFVPNSGSVVAFQGTVPWSVLGTITGSVAAVQSGTAITSVSGVVNTAGSVVAFQGTNPWIVTGSVQATLTPAANQSISGTVGASLIGLSPVSVSNFPTNQNVSGSIVAFQGTNPFIITGSVQGSFTPSGNQSISGTVATNVQGSVATVIIGGSIAASFTPPANQSVSGTVQTQVQASVAVVIIGGSILTSSTANQSVSGTVGASIIGAVPVVQSGAWTHSVIGTYSDSTVSSTVTGIPFMFKANVSSSVMQAVSPTFPLPVSGSQSIQGTVSVLGTVPITQSGSWFSSVSGSVTALQGTNPWIQTFSNSSILAVPVGSVITVFQAPSIVGTYAEDAPSASGDKGFLVMGARNDTLSSVTSNDGDYSSHVVGPAGELIAENAPLNKWISGTASALGGTPATGSLIPIIAAQGASVFTYITGLQVANPSGTNVWVTLLGATNSVIGFTVAPANGGSNIYYQNGLKTNANAAFSASVNAVGSVYLSAQGFISKT